MSYIYGKHAVQECLRLYPTVAKELWYTSIGHLQLLPEAIVSKLPKHEVRPFELMNRFNLQPFESHQGLLLEIKEDLKSLLSIRLEDLLIEASQTHKSLIWLPEIQDGHNLGAIVRSAVTFKQIAGIVIPTKNGVQLGQIVAKVSAGTVFSMKFANSHSVKATVQLIKSAGFQLIAIEKKKEAILLNNFDFKSNLPAILIFGSEGDGIPLNISNQCSCSIQIPQSENIDSLNLSVSAGIVLYEMYKQNK